MPVEYQFLPILVRVLSRKFSLGGKLRCNRRQHITLKQLYSASEGVFPKKILIFPLSGIDSDAF